MEVDEIIKAVIEFGTEAVLRYRTVASLRHDNELPEVFFGGFVACRLYDRFRCPVHVEHPYLTVARHREAHITPDLEERLRQLRADVGLYRQGVPPAIIEFKILDETCPFSSVVGDIQKASQLAERFKVDVYLGFMICETADHLDARVSKLQDVLGRAVHTGDPQKSASGEWSWCFGCCSLSETDLAG